MAEEYLQAAFEIKAACDDISRKLLRWHWEEKPGAHSVDALLKQSFRPEFLNRLDEIVFYKPLRKEEIFKIIDLLAASLKQRLKDKQISLEITDSAKQAIVDASYDPSFGARPLKRYIQRNVETMVAKEILRDEVRQGDIITIDEQNGELTSYVQHNEE